MTTIHASKWMGRSVMAMALILTPFALNAVDYSISGQISGDIIGGVTVDLSGSSSDTTTTTLSGTYVFSNVTTGTGTYTVTPSHPAATFSPPSSIVTINFADQTANFLSIYKPFDISGVLTLSGPLTDTDGATISLFENTTLVASKMLDSSGTYVFTAHAGTFTYTVTHPQYTFTISSPKNSKVKVVASDKVQNVSAVSQHKPYKAYGTISGDVSSSVTVRAVGPVNRSGISDATGAYEISGLIDGAYTFTPSRAGYVFTLSHTTVVIADSDVVGVDFSSSGIRQDISGRIYGSVFANVTVTLTGTENLTTTTNLSGSFLFTAVLPGWYTVTPSSALATFSPVSQAVQVTTADVKYIVFTSVNSSVATYSISGQMTGAHQEGFVVSIGGPVKGKAYTDANGNYTFTGVIPNGTYTIVPFSFYYNFTPVSTTVTVSNADITGVNFQVTAKKSSKGGNHLRCAMGEERDIPANTAGLMALFLAAGVVSFLRRDKRC